MMEAVSTFEMSVGIYQTVLWQPEISDNIY
jgi:hypothetical protein